MNRGKLGRTGAHRRAMFRNSVTSLFEHGRIRTTLGKARQVRPEAERLINLAKRGNLHARRLVEAYVVDSLVAKKLFEDIAPKYKERQGGYVRIIRLGERRGDGAPEVIIELV
ncbi:MAG: 50S ribosomal protein L17 [Firmicutes bacterium]|nr:50S ribosomal protein L17 [Bacillota bacterium]